MTPMSTTRIAIALACLGLICAAGEGCRTRSVRSSGSITIGSRQVKFSTDGGGSITKGKGPAADSEPGAGGEAEAAIITFAEGQVIVEQEGVFLKQEGSRFKGPKSTTMREASVPQDAKVVEVDYSAGILTITADGKKVSTSEDLRHNQQ
jgi:hypothetical protein